MSETTSLADVEESTSDVQNGAELEVSTEWSPSEQEVQEEHLIYYSKERVSKPFITNTYVLPDTWTHSPPELELVEALGYDSCRRHNLHKIGADSLLFVAGNYVCVHKLSTGKNTYLRSTGGGAVKCLAVNRANELCFAAGESGWHPDINVYGFPSCRMRKVLRGGTHTEYTCLEFDPYTGELLASQGGEPDYNLTIWNWIKEVPLLRCKSFSDDVYHISWNHELFGFLVTSGVGHIRFWRLAATFTGLKLKGQTGRFGKRDHVDIEASILFPDGKVLTGSDVGTILLWEEALIKAEFQRKKFPYCHKGPIHQMLMHEGEVITLGEDGYIRMWPVDTILWVDPAEPGDIFCMEPLHEVNVAHHSGLMRMVQADAKNLEDRRWFVQETSGKVWLVDLDIGITRKPVAIFSNHGGPVLDCAVSPCTHLAATVGEDGTLRIYDCIEHTQLLCMRFKSPAACLIWMPLSLDPEGTSVIVGFGSGIIRKIVFCEAAAADPDVSHRDSLDGKLSQVFKPHKSRVTSIAFSHDGYHYFVSGSSDGIFFLFHVNEEISFEPVGWVTLPSGIRQLAWTPSSFSYRAVLASCDEGVVLEVFLGDMCELTITANYRIIDLSMNVFKFQSLKSELEHTNLMSRLRKEWLRIHAQQAAIREAQKESGQKDEEEEGKDKWEEDQEWQPYIPETVSPILQALYSSQEHHFWLSLGDYDADYLYFCNFSYPSVSASETRADLSKYFTKPLKTITVPNSKGSAVTVLKMEDNQALLGFSNGHVRLVQIDPKIELEDLEAYWDLAVHDNSTGSVTGLHFAFDESFFLTTGKDGNVMLFDHRGRLKRLDQNAAIWPDTHSHHDICDEDLKPDSYWFPDTIDMARQDKKARAAEEAKKHKRTIIKLLQQKLRAVLLQNNQLPPHHRLSKTDQLMNVHMKEDHEENLKKELAGVRDTYAWQTEKSRLLLKKIREGFHSHEDMPHQFSVTAFNNPNLCVKSYRVFRPLKQIEGGVTGPVSRTSIMSIVMSKADEEEMELSWMDQDEVWQAVYNMTRCHSRGLTGSTFRSLKQALDRAMEARQRRQQRKKEWALLYKQKPGPHKMDNPRDLAKIERAKQTIGDLQLKTDLSRRAIEMAESFVYEDNRAALVRLDHTFCDKIAQFNDKLKRLRQSKQTVERIYDHLERRVRLDSYGTTELPRPRMLSREEVPEMDLTFDENSLLKFWKDNKESLDENDFKKLGKDNAASFHHQFYKGERQEYPDIVKLVREQTAASQHRTEPENDVYMDPILCGEADESDLTSDLRHYVNTFNKLRIDFEEALVNSLFQNIMDEFDDKLRELRIEKFELDVALKNSELEYYLKVEEVLMDKQTVIEEREFKRELMSKQQELLRAQDAICRLRRQIADLTTDSETITKKITDLWTTFRTLVVDMEGKRMMAYLTLLFKRIVRKKKERSEDEEDDSEYDSSSEMSDMLSNSGCDSTASSLNLDYCPDTLSQELYDNVLVLQVERQLLDDSNTELKKQLANLTKDLEQRVKDADVIGRALEKLQARIILFYEEKIRMLNELDVVVVLPCLGIHSKTEKGIVIDRCTIRRLLDRIISLKKEQQVQKSIMKADRRRHVSLKTTIRSMEKKMAEKSFECEDAIIKKFGKHVCLRKLELLTINPKLEILRCRLLSDRSEHLEEIQKYDKAIEEEKFARVHRTRTNSAKTRAMTALISEKIKLERRLDKFQTTAVDVCEIIPPKSESVEDREIMCLTQLVKEQATVINSCWDSIASLSRMGARSEGTRLHLQHISDRYSVSRAQGTRNVLPEMPGSRPAKYLSPL